MGRRSPVPAVTLSGLRFDLLFVDGGAMDVIGRAATLVPEKRIEAMPFHLTTEGHINTGDEQGRTETDGSSSSFASEPDKWLVNGR